MDDLPAVEKRVFKLHHGLQLWVKWVNRNGISNAVEFVPNELGTKMRVALGHFFRAVPDLVLDDVL